MNQRTQIKDFTQGSIPRQLVAFATPLFLSNLLQIVYNMVDMMVVGSVMGKAGTSAVSVGGDVSNLLTFVAMGFASAGQVIIARLIGAGERKKLARFVGTMVGFLTVAAVIMSVLGLILQDTMLTLMKTPDEAYEGAVAYSTVCMAGLIFMYGYNMTSAILRGMGDSTRPFYFLVVCALLNTALDLLFVIVFHMNVAGVALATTISQGVSAVLVHTEKGRSFLSRIEGLKLFETTFERVIEKNPNIINPRKRKPETDKFERLMQEHDLFYAVKHSRRLRTRIKSLIKGLLNRK